MLLTKAQTRDWQSLKSNPAITVRLCLPASVAIEISTSALNRPATDHTALTPADLKTVSATVGQLIMDGPDWSTDKGQWLQSVKN